MTPVRTILTDPSKSQDERYELLRQHFQCLLAKPYAEPETSYQVRERFQRQSSARNQILITGGKVKPEWEPIDRLTEGS